MIEREYRMVCVLCHRTYVRLRSTEILEFGVCDQCGQPGRLTLLPPIVVLPRFVDIDHT